MRILLAMMARLNCAYLHQRVEAGMARTTYATMAQRSCADPLWPLRVLRKEKAAKRSDAFTDMTSAGDALRRRSRMARTSDYFGSS